LRQRTHARAHALVGWLSGRLDLSVRPCGRARGVAGVGVVYQHLVTWPGLTEEAINKNLKLTPATAMGYMNQTRDNIRSNSKTPITTAIEDITTTNTNLGTKTNLVYAVLVDQGQLYMDLTGKFLVRSSKGNSYVMACYVYDCNYLKVVPMKSHCCNCMKRFMIFWMHR
jgi:hypothetical protein